MLLLMAVSAGSMVLQRRGCLGGVLLPDIQFEAAH